METTEKYADIKKEDVIRRLPEHLRCGRLEHASEDDSPDVEFMNKTVGLNSYVQIFLYSSPV